MLLTGLLPFTLPAFSRPPGVDLLLTSRDYDAREVEDGALLNRERGRLEGLGFSVAVDGWRGRWSLQAAHESGMMSYAGLDQLGAPVVTVTDLGADSVALRWTPDWRPAYRMVTLDSHFELAHQIIERDIQRGPLSRPLSEHMQSVWLRAGSTLRMPLSGDWSMELDGQLAWPLQQQLHVDSFGVYDDFVLKPQARASLQAGFAISWQATGDLRLLLRATHERWQFGASAEKQISKQGTVVAVAEYPGSRQRMNGFSLQVRRTF